MKILLVDSTHSELARMNRTILHLGGKTISARSGCEALEQFEREHPDLILLAFPLPDLGANDFVQKVRTAETAGNWTPIIFMAAQSEDAEIERGILAGGDDFLFKPVSEALLSAKLRAMYRIVQMRTSLVALTRKLDTANQELLRLSSSDGLTGIPNRRYFDEALDREWRRSRRLGHELALIICDVDHFKRFNDFYGHQAGDECLRQVAQALAGAIDRGGDTPARYGGEEFVAILPDTDRDGAGIVAERIRQAVLALGIPHAQSIFGEVTISLGIACMVPDDKLQAKSLIQAADQALYQAKQEGRNRVCCHAQSYLLETGDT